MNTATERQRAVKKANERIAHLREQGANFNAKLGIYGLEITHFRPSSRKDHVSISTEIIPIPQ